MLNEILLDPKDKEICKLKIQIEQFKKYDKERKEYYRNICTKVGELESFVYEMQDDIENGNLIKKIKAQRAVIKRLENEIKELKIKLNEKISN